ncbi:MAG: hypothetical protein R2764_09595 [Bacteroidales bacterium]
MNKEDPIAYTEIKEKEKLKSGLKSYSCCAKVLQSDEEKGMASKTHGQTGKCGV